MHAYKSLIIFYMVLVKEKVNPIYYTDLLTIYLGTFFEDVKNPSPKHTQMMRLRCCRGCTGALVLSGCRELRPYLARDLARVRLCLSGVSLTLP